MSGLLFTEGRIGRLRLSSRIIMSAMHLGLSLEREAAFLAERCRGGAALVTTVMGVASSAAPFDMPVLCPENRARLMAMADQVHAAGGLLSVQLFHVGRNCEEGRLADPDAWPVAPSPVPSPIYRTVPRELTWEQMEEICLQFAQAALLCRTCGVDAVEISSSAGYLLSEFLSALTNLRTDEYGGDFAHRAAMPLRVIRAVREAVGSDYPVILRISGADMLGGYGLAEMRQFVSWASGDIDAVSVTGGWHESPVPQISMDVPEGGFAFLARAIRQAAGVPVIACNRINNAAVAERLLEEGYGDFVGCARAFLADSGFGEKIRRNIPYMRCIGCNKGCIEQVLRHRPATCIFNPMVGREAVRIPQAAVKQRVLVVGGGPAGLYASEYLARSGHQVTLCTGEDQWGGLLRYAGLPPHKQNILHNIDVMVYRAQQAGVSMRAGTVVDARFLESQSFDVCFIAEGCRERTLSIQGADTNRVIPAREIFEADPDVLAELAWKNICIIGGGSIGVELALYLYSGTGPSSASRRFLDQFVPEAMRPTLGMGGKTTIVELTNKIARDLGSTRWIVLKQLQQFPVETMTNSTVREITETGVEIAQGEHTMTREADVVILAAGYEPRSGALTGWLEAHGKPYYKIGDCAGEGQGIMGATQSAYRAAAAYGGYGDEKT